MSNRQMGSRFSSGSGEEALGFVGRYFLGTYESDGDQLTDIGVVARAGQGR